MAPNATFGGRHKHFNATGNKDLAGLPHPWRHRHSMGRSLRGGVATLIDARSQHGSARQWLLINAGTSTVAAVALGVAPTPGVAAALAVFGIWAAVSGAAQLVVILRAARQPVAAAARQRRVGHRWCAFIIAAFVGHPKLGMLAIYAATGGVEFVIQAWLLARRSRQLASAIPVMSAG